MCVSKSDYDEVRAIFRTRKQKEAFYAVVICGGLFILALVVGILTGGVMWP